MRGWGLGWLFGTCFTELWGSGDWLNFGNSTQSVFITAACSAYSPVELQPVLIITGVGMSLFET